MKDLGNLSSDPSFLYIFKDKLNIPPPTNNFSNALGSSNANTKTLNSQFGSKFSTTARHSAHAEARAGMAKREMEDQKTGI